MGLFSDYWMSFDEWESNKKWFAVRELELKNKLLWEEVERLRNDLNEYKEAEKKAEVDRKEKEESTKKVAKDITTIVDGFLGLEKGSVFVLNQELGRYEHNWSNENVTRNVSFSANLFDRNSKFFQVLSWVE